MKHCILFACREYSSQGYFLNAASPWNRNFREALAELAELAVARGGYGYPPAGSFVVILPSRRIEERLVGLTTSSSGSSFGFRGIDGIKTFDYLIGNL